jgi:hypothetical protein
MLQSKFRHVDWSKVGTLDDLKLILEACQIQISSEHVLFDKVERFLKPASPCCERDYDGDGRCQIHFPQP